MKVPSSGNPQGSLSEKFIFFLHFTVIVVLASLCVWLGGENEKLKKKVDQLTPSGLQPSSGPLR